MKRCAGAFFLWQAGVGTNPKLEPIVKPFDEVFSRSRGEKGDKEE